MKKEPFQAAILPNELGFWQRGDNIFFVCFLGNKRLEKASPHSLEISLSLVTTAIGIAGCFLLALGN